MNYASMADLSRDLGHVSIDDYPNTRLLPYFNLVKDDYWTYLITAIKTKYRWDIWTVQNTVINQSEYRIPEAAIDAEGNLKINGIAVSYDGDSYTDGTKIYKKAREVEPETLAHHWNHYINNQPANDPIYYTADRSIFIAPSFDSVLQDAIEIRGIKNIPDYTVDSTDGDIGLPYYLHTDLVQGVLYYIHMSEGRQSDAEVAKKRYEDKKQDAYQKMFNKTVGPGFMNYPEDVDSDSIFKTN